MTRLHVIGLPHTRFTDDYSWCAYSTKVARFAKMMTDTGVETITYGNGHADLPGKYVMVTDNEFADHYIPEFDATLPLWSEFNNKATARVLEHIESDDIVCLIGGMAQAPIGWALASWPVVEFGIGYEGVFAKYRVWESYTWQHYVLGMLKENGSAHDTVIYNYFDPEDFYVSQYPGEYLAFLGRVCYVKGIDLAVAAAREAGVPLKIAGHVFDDAAWVRDLSGDIEYVGELGPRDRAEFLARSSALIAPTRYVEPFGGVQVEAWLSGVPVIGPDFGAFAEFIDADNGVRCRSVKDFAAAVSRVGELPQGLAVRERAEDKFSMSAIGPRYARYFDGIT